MADDPGAADWAQAARENASDAAALARHGSWRNAYIQAGFAVECALKGRLMRHLGLNRWPDRRERPEFYVHDLARLADLAGLTQTLEVAVTERTPQGLAWMIAKDFSINRRYPTGRPFPYRLGRDMVEVVAGRDGLVEWLIQSM